MVKRPYILYNIKPNTRAAQKLLESGRFGMYGIELGTNLHAIVFTCYGWTNGRGNPLARDRTNNMCKIVFHEIQTHPAVPMLFTGDLNCDREQLVHVEQLLNEFHWTDLGASADMWVRTQTIVRREKQQCRNKTRTKARQTPWQETKLCLIPRKCLIISNIEKSVAASPYLLCTGLATHYCTRNTAYHILRG